MLSGLEKALLAVLVLVLMTGMGATLTPAAFKDIARRPRGVLIGIASQFGWMPLIAFALALTLDLPAEAAVGLILIGSTPGGTTSNLFTYYAKADLALSISMTAVSTVVAIGVMPLVLSVYATRFTDASLAIPYASIATTLAVVLVPVAIGMGIRHKSEKAARVTEKVGSLAGVGVLLLLVGSSLYRNGHLLAEMTPQLYIATIGLGLLGIVLGYGAATVAGLARPARRAVGLETGIQNSPLALAIIVATFPEAQHWGLMMPPLMYALFVLISSTLVTLVWRRTSDLA